MLNIYTQLNKAPFQQQITLNEAEPSAGIKLTQSRFLRLCSDCTQNLFGF